MLIGISLSFPFFFKFTRAYISESSNLVNVLEIFRQTGLAKNSFYFFEYEIVVQRKRDKWN